MTAHLVTFSDESMSRSRELCAESALMNGISEAHHVHIYSPSMLPTKMRERCMGVRGCGFWSWKPEIIRRGMNYCNSGDVLIYADAGVELINNVSHIIDRMDQDIFLFGNNWEHAHWCKADVVQWVWPDYSEYKEPFWERFGKQAQASVIFFRVSKRSRDFVAEWLHWCLFEGGRLIDDSPSRTPNHPEFREHRHDQAILTTLAYREGIKLHWWPAVYNKGGSPEFVYEKLPEYAGDDYPVLFSHHRKRNHEWSEAA